MKKPFYFLIFVLHFFVENVAYAQCDSIEICFPSEFVSPVTCYGDSNGRAIVSTNYPVNSYVWDNGVTTSHNSFLHTGYNSVTVHLVGGCFKTDSVFIAGPDPLSVTLSTNVTNCTNGHIIIDSIFGGTFPYDIEWSNGSNAYSISNITLDSAYYYEITDIRGCKITDTVIIPSTVPINASISKRQVSCYGNANGQLITNVSGGASPYIYHWNNGATNSIIDNLVAGEYSVIVTDANGCTFTITDTIKQPSELKIDSYYIINANCNDSLGSICVDVQGGIWPYNFSWNGDSLNDFWCLHDSPGLYDLRVTDGNGCVVTHLFTIGTDPNPTAHITTSSTQICVGDIVTLTAIGGVSYHWNNGSITQTLMDNPTISTTYKVTVTDVNGCSDTDSIYVHVNEVIADIIASDSQVCLGDNITLAATGGTSYYWSTGETSSIIVKTPNQTTTYVVTVTDANGCSDTDSVNVIVNQVVANITASSTSITAGTPVVLSSDIADEYTWSTGETLQTIVVYPTVTTQYSLVVRTGNCTDITSITINVVNSTDPDDPNDPNNPTTILPLNFELGDLHYVCYNHDPIVLQNYVNIDLSHGGQVNFVGPGVAGGIFYPSSVGPAGTFQIMAFYTDPITHQEYQGAQSITVQPGTTLDWILNQSVVYLYSQPFVLTGAQPLGGVYSGNGVFHDNGVYYFDPAVAGLGNHTLTYTYTNEWGCESVTSKMISVSSQTGIDDVLDTDISVYPNPVNSVLNISLNKNISDILLIDMLGCLVEQQQVCGQSKIQINMNTYSNGIYLLRFVSQDGQITTKKVIKQ